MKGEQEMAMEFYEEGEYIRESYDLPPEWDWAPPVTLEEATSPVPLEEIGDYDKLLLRVRTVQAQLGLRPGPRSGLAELQPLELLP